MNDNSAQKFFGIVIPKEVLDNKEVRLPDKMIYGYIASYKNYCAEPNHAIADKIGISTSSVAHGLARLEQAGLIFIEKVNGDNSKRRIYGLVNKPGTAEYLRQKNLWKTCGKLEGYRAQYARRNAPRARLRAQYALDKTGNVMHNMHIKNKRIKKNIDEPDDFDESESPPKARKGAFVGLTIADRDAGNFEEEFYRRNTMVIGAF